MQPITSVTPSENTEETTVTLLCSNCAGKMNEHQQNYSITLREGNTTVVLFVSNIVCIRSDGNYCLFQVLVPNMPMQQKVFRVRTSLSQCETLIAYGLVRVSRYDILNLSHVFRIKSTKLYSYHLQKGVEVTKTYHVQVSAMLKRWLHVVHDFAC